MLLACLYCFSEDKVGGVGVTKDRKLLARFYCLSEGGVGVIKDRRFLSCLYFSVRVRWGGLGGN